jgi:hypothetical protein
MVWISARPDNRDMTNLERDDANTGSPFQVDSGCLNFLYIENPVTAAVDQ